MIESIRSPREPPPAGHQHGRVCLKVRVANHEGGVSQNVAMAEFVEVQHHVIAVARELLHISRRRAPQLLPPVHPVSFHRLHHTRLCRREEEEDEGHFRGLNDGAVWCVNW